MSKKFLCLAVAGTLLPSCSVYKAVNQPDAKNLAVLSKGTPRDEVIAELGAPIHSDGPVTARRDVFSFVQGYSKGNKTARATMHTVASGMTLGLWEVIGTPAESIADGTEVTARVSYDRKQRVSQVAGLKGKEKLKGYITE